MSFQSYLKIIEKILTFGSLKANDRVKLVTSDLCANTCWSYKSNLFRLFGSFLNEKEISCLWFWHTQMLIVCMHF